MYTHVVYYVYIRSSGELAHASNLLDHSSIFSAFSDVLLIPVGLSVICFEVLKCDVTKLYILVCLVR